MVFLHTQAFFESRPASVRCARGYVRRTLAAWGVWQRVDDVLLCATELAGNALVHGTVAEHGFTVCLDLEGDVLRISVWDSSERHPALRVPEGDEVGGRGLVVVDALADRWGAVKRNPLGKVVWAEFEVSSPPTPAGFIPGTGAVAGELCGPRGLQSERQ